MGKYKYIPEKYNLNASRLKHLTSGGEGSWWNAADPHEGSATPLRVCLRGRVFAI
jgi:hypothetical protein